MTVLVLGAAVSGRAAMRLAARLGHRVVLYDRDAGAVAGLDELATIETGEWRPAMLDGVDLVVTSPGIPEGAPPIGDTIDAGLPLVSELEFAAGHLSGPYLAVTGTNGKTTVTETTAAMLTASGLRSCAAGNVGLALSDVALDPWDCVVVEASSFQLRFIDRFHPVGAAILNIAPDHLDWHGSSEAYAAAKTRIHENQTGADLLAYDADDAGAAAAVAEAASMRVAVSGRNRPPGGNGPDGTHLVIGDLELTRPDLDPVWMLDMAVAATLARHAGATPDAVESVIAGFTPGPHRRTVVAVAGGVTWVDDSKATNPHAAVAAAGAYPSVVLIAGGRNKGLDLSPIAAVPGIRHIVAIGEAATELAAAAGERAVVVADLETAVATAAQLAVPGDTVLLAPGCASFDMFTSYGERGDRFQAEVLRTVGNSDAGQ